MDLLKKIEWAGGDSGEDVCLWCGGRDREGQGHKPGCEFAALIGGA